MDAEKSGEMVVHGVAMSRTRLSAPTICRGWADAGRRAEMVARGDPGSPSPELQGDGARRGGARGAASGSQCPGGARVGGPRGA